MDAIAQVPQLDSSKFEQVMNSTMQVKEAVHMLFWLKLWCSKLVSSSLLWNEKKETAVMNVLGSEYFHKFEQQLTSDFFTSPKEIVLSTNITL